MENGSSKQKSFKYQLLIFFCLAYGISWLLWAPLWLPAFGVEGLPTLPFHHAIGAFGPMAAAIMVTMFYSGSKGVVKLLSRVFLWRNRVRWIAIALFAPFVLYLFAVMSLYIFSGEPISFENLGISSEFQQFSFSGFIIYNVLTFGYGEETGWRGFALPRLQQQYSALTSTLFLTLFWALWHLPLFHYRPGYMDMNAAGVAGWFFSLLTGAILLTWLYNSSKGSVLVVALFHATIDVVFTSDSSSDQVINALGFLITVWGIGILVFSGPKYLSKIGKMVYNRDEEQGLSRR